MKRKMPLILSLVFIVFIGIWSGIIIKARESNIKFTDLYGNRSELDNVQFDLQKSKGVRIENLDINKNGIESKTTLEDDVFFGRDFGDDIPLDKEFFRGLFPTRETFFQNEDIMVDISNRLYEQEPNFEVRIKNKKDNNYEKFKVKVDGEITDNYRINGITYKDGKINILLASNYKEDSINFGEIDVKSKTFRISKTINLDEVYKGNNSYLYNEFDGIYDGKIYFTMNTYHEDSGNKEFGLTGFLEVDLNNKSIEVYKIDESVLNDIKSMKKPQQVGQIDFKNEKIYMQILGEYGDSTSVLTFNMETKKVTFYKNLIERERFERYDVKFSNIDKVFIEGDKAYLNLIAYNEEDPICYKGYIAVLDINSKNPVYIGKYDDGILDNIKIIGGK
ncbi:hypothetical protein [Clostridium sp. B9]|uniref:hypothetical protein n=1 Tax=Clostridium sp. B9 TaxID=3423224 RepID=UPI003D2EACB4